MRFELTTPEGWNGVITTDPDSTRYLLLSNFTGSNRCTLTNINTSLGKPVFSNETVITQAGSTASFSIEENHSVANTLKFFIKGEDVVAVQEENDPNIIYIHNNTNKKNTIFVTAVENGKCLSKKVKINKKCLELSLQKGKIRFL